MVLRDDEIDSVRRVAIRLGPIAERAVFVGGAVIPLLLTDPAAASPRPTLDVDVVIELTSSGKYAELVSQLRSRGFEEDTAANAPACRWLVEGLRVDVMPSDGSILGFTNRWYPAVVSRPTACDLPGGPTIRLVSAPLFLATKLEAFRGRGREDFRASHDLEDLVAVVDGRTELEGEVRSAAARVREFLGTELRALLATPAFVEALPGYLHGDRGSQARLPLIRARLERISHATT
jgi:hypothetical protein